MKKETRNTHELTHLSAMNRKSRINFCKSLSLLLSILCLVSFLSCKNELAEDFVVELVEDPYNLNNSYTVDDIAYFNLSLKILDESVVQYPGDTSGPYRYIFPNQRLERGDILRLENSLEPGYYILEGYACTKDDYYICNVYGKSNKMTPIEVNEGNIVTKDFITVESGVPTVIKLIVPIL